MGLVYDKKNKDAPYALNLFFTGKCNLNCRYCFVDKRGQENLTLGEGSIKKGVKTLYDFPGKEKTFSFNGGEPTLEFSLVKRIFKVIENGGKRTKSRLNVALMTNGTLLNQKMIDFFEKKRIIVKISIDGDRLSHDRQRPFKSEKTSSFERIISNLDKVKIKKLQLAASMVFSPETLDDFFKNLEFLRKNKFVYIEFYPDLYAVWTKNDLLKLGRIFEELPGYFIKLFRDDAEKKIRNSLLDAFTNNFEMNRMENCGKIHLSADGYFYACDKVFSLGADKRKKYIVGRPETGVDEMKRKIIFEDIRKNFFMKSGLKCRQCRFKKYCFCPIGHYIFFSEMRPEKMKNFYDSFCFISKTYARTFLKIKKSLKYNKNFVKMHKI